MNPAKLFIIVSAAAIFYSCKEDIVSPAQIIRFETPQEESLAADNYSTLKIRAIIPKDADLAFHAIKFKTDIGQFSNDGKEITVQADGEGNADVYIHSKDAGTATVNASVSTYSADKKIIFTLADVTALIRFDGFDQTPVPSDNVTERLIRIIINENTAPDKRKVTFNADNGTFTNNQSTIEVVAGPDNIAETYIKNGSPVKSKIRAGCNGFETETTLQFVPPEPDNIIYFIDGAATSAAADGVSPIEISAKINPKVQADLRKVNFVTGIGSFENGLKTEEVPADADGIARVLLTGITEGNAFVSATHKGLTRTKTFVFERAYPEDISINSAFSVSSGIALKLPISIQLSRQTGKPGVNFQIDYTARDSSDHDIGLFKNSTLSGTNGQAQVDFSAGITTYRGPVTISASVKERPSVNASTTIYVTD